MAAVIAETALVPGIALAALVGIDNVLDAIGFANEDEKGLGLWNPVSETLQTFVTWWKKMSGI